MKKFIFTTLSAALFCTGLQAQNVGIGTNAPNASAKLEVLDANRGVLIPRVALSATTVAAPVTAPANSLLVYNTATAGDVTPGFYYWSTTANAWIRFAEGKAGWEITGNNGITAANFLGTINNADLIIRTNNTEKMRVMSGGNVGIGTAAPVSRLNVVGKTTLSRDNVAECCGNDATLVIAENSAGTGRLSSISFHNSGLAEGQIHLTSTATGLGGSDRRFRMFDNQGVNMGLEITGNLFFGNNYSRTQYRDNAGLQGNAGAQSGFYETFNPVNYPAGASSWWHLIDSRHSNNANNYALQIAGSFFDQDLWFRKTNNNAAQAWSKILTSTSGWMTLGNAGTNAGTNFIGTTDAVDFVTRTSNTERMRVTSGGNVGIGIAAPTQRLDVQGGNARINNAFIGDVGHGANWGGISHSNQNNTTGYGLISSSDGNFTLINKQNTGGGFIGFRVGNVDQAVILNNGYMGVGTSAPTSRLHVVSDGDNIPVVYGINTNNTAATTSFGVRGECASTGLGSAGVSGVSTNSSQNEIGVVGDYSLWGASLFGLAWASSYADMPASRDFGVFATCNFSTGTGVYARDMNGAAGSYAFYGTGKFSVTGAKAASVPTTKGNQLVYCTESPEIWFEDLGTATLQNGSVHIRLDDMFYETVFISEEHPMHVFLQEQGDCAGLYFIPDADGKGFTVKEKQAGRSNIRFSYRIMAKRRFYQDHRFGVDSNQPFEDNLSKAKNVEPITTDPQEMKRWVEEQTRMKEAAAGYKAPENK